MTQSAVRKYEVPRAVRLGDAASGEFACANGSNGTMDTCLPSGSTPDVNKCSTGMSVMF